MRWNPLERREEQLVDRLFEVLSQFDMNNGIDISLSRRTIKVIVPVPSVPPGLQEALQTAAGPRFQVQLIADPGFQSPIGVARISSREATDEEKRMLLRHAAGKSSQLPADVRAEIASRLHSGKDPDSIIAWLTEKMGWHGGEH